MSFARGVLFYVMDRFGIRSWDRIPTYLFELRSSVEQFPRGEKPACFTCRVEGELCVCFDSNANCQL